MKHTTNTTLEPVMVAGGYISPEIHDGKYRVWLGFTVHKDGTTEYVGTHNHRVTTSSAVYDTYRKGPMADD